MAYPSPEAIAAIQARVAAISAWTKADAAVLADLRADTIPNPTPQPTVAVPYTVSDLMNRLTATQRAAIYTRPGAPAFAEAVRTQDQAATLAWISLASDAGDIAAADLATLAGIVRATRPDPAWPATVPQLDVTLGRPLDLDDVAAARPGA